MVASQNPAAFIAWLTNSPGEQTAEFKDDVSPSDSTETAKVLGSVMKSAGCAESPRSRVRGMINEAGVSGIGTGH